MLPEKITSQAEAPLHPPALLVAHSSTYEMIQILVIDDNHERRSWMLSLIKNADYAVAAVSSRNVETALILAPEIVVLGDYEAGTRDKLQHLLGDLAESYLLRVGVDPLRGEEEPLSLFFWRFVTAHELPRLITHINEVARFIAQDRAAFQIEELDPNQPLVLMLGEVTHEGVVSTLRAMDRQFKKKMLVSSPSNWATISAYFDKFEVTTVLVKLSARVYVHLADPDYQEERDRLFYRICRVPHAIFVFESLLTNEESSPFADGFYRPPEGVLMEVNGWMQSLGLSVVSYSKNAEVTLAAQALVTETEEGLLFRLYVPSNRIWSAETDKLLQLFRDYLNRIGHSSVRLDQTRTRQGVIYEFHSDRNTQDGQLAEEFQAFTRLLDLTVSDPTAAERLLRDKHVDAHEIAEILVRYSKEAKRLHVDLRHERQRKTLSIRQRIESELVDALPPPHWNDIERLVEIAVPQVTGVANALEIDQRPALLSGISTNSLTVNVGSNIIDAVNAVVAQEITGEVHLNDYDQELLALVRAHGADKAPELTSAVHELADTSAPRAGRVLAKQKIKSFLFHVASKASDAATGVLQSYVESKLGL
jgi:hypothetical protein